MSGILLTQYSGSILGPIAKLLGYLMNGIFFVLDKIGIPNIGLSIIIFTIVIYLLLTPLTVKQQKFSKLQGKMNPEIQAIQAKYKNKKDNESVMAMQQEMKAVYAKYGVSQTGSCVQLLIQMPILLALYRVIYAIPAYVSQVGNTFRVLAEKIVEQDNGEFLLAVTKESGFSSSLVTSIAQNSKNIAANLTNGIIDVLNKASTSDFSMLAEKYNLSSLQYNGQNILSSIDANGKIISKGLIDTYNYFLGINIANSPQFMFTNGWSAHRFGLCFAAILIPVLAAVTQWINTKLMPQPESANKDGRVDPNDTTATMQQSMKTMNMMMPLMSAFFCFTLPSGMGLYWIAGAVIRTVQMIFINKHIDKMDIDEIIKKNEAKAKQKMEKAGVRAEQMQKYAAMNTRNINGTAAKANMTSSMTDEQREQIIKAAQEKNSKAPAGSIAAKANMVKEYNERNNK